MGTLFTISFIGVLDVIALVDAITHRGQRGNE